MVPCVQLDEMDEMSILRDHGIWNVSMPAQRPLRFSLVFHTRETNPFTETIPRPSRVRATVGGLTAGGHMANRPPGRLCCRGSMVVCSSGRMEEGRPSLRQAQPVRLSVGTVVDARSKRKSSWSISPHHGHIVRLVSTHDSPGCTASSSSISQLWQNRNVPLRFGPLHRSPSLDT